MALHELTASAAGSRRSPDDLLSARGLEVAYGGSAPALRGVSLAVPRAGAVALLGANGAGKTTTLRALSGLVGVHNGRIRGGEVWLRGERIEQLHPHEIVARGVGQVPEGRMIFANLTVEENLRVGATPRKASRDEPMLEDIFGLFPVLRERRGGRAGWLSGGEQQMLAIGRALMGRPALLLLDEVSLGLAPKLTRTIFERLQTVRAEAGSALLVVEQNAKLALEFCDYAYVLESGRIVLEGPSNTLSEDEQVQDLYLGGAPGEERRSFATAKRYRRRKRWLA